MGAIDFDRIAKRRRAIGKPLAKNWRPDFTSPPEFFFRPAACGRARQSLITFKAAAPSPN